MTYWNVVKKVVDKADVILLVLDARMPELSMNDSIIDMVEKREKSLFVVFNKIDLISDDALIKLKRKYKKSFFVAAARNDGMGRVKSAIMIEAKRKKIETPKVGVVGYPNVGKSAIINALAHRAKVAISPVAGTTKGQQLIRAGGIRVIDTPGVFPYRDREVKLGLLSAKNPEDLRNPEKLAITIIKKVLRENKKAFEDLYKINVDDFEDEYEILLGVGKKRNYLEKKGEIDERRAAITIIRDWQKGKLRI